MPIGNSANLNLMQRNKPERDAELYRAFKRAFASPNVHSYSQAVKQAVNSPCSQFYISAEESYRYIRRTQKNGGVPVTRWRWGGKISRHNQKALHLVYLRYMELSKHKAFQGCSTFFIASFACSSPAPCFFLSIRRAYDIISKMRKINKHK